MYNNKFSKETIWAISIIIVCILAGCFLFFKYVNTTSDTFTFFSSKEIIVLTEKKSKSYESKTSFTGTDTLPSFMDTENIDFETSESFTELSIPPYDCPIDFESLWEINKDVYAWITIPGTIIDYPILQHATDNSYYLNYTMDRIEGFPGCIYTENMNSKDFTDNNTVIYGHNMRNGTMFTDLHKFRDSNFFNEHDTIHIYTPEKQLTYKIFAAYLYDDRHLLNSFDFSAPEVYRNYLSEIQAMNSEDVNIKKEIKITETDKIITLITCIREEPEKRVYVQAVLESHDI